MGSERGRQHAPGLSDGPKADLLIGLAYVALVLYLPYGIVGTWRVKTLGGGWRNSPLGRLVARARA